MGWTTVRRCSLMMSWKTRGGPELAASTVQAEVVTCRIRRRREQPTEERASRSPVLEIDVASRPCRNGTQVWEAACQDGRRVLHSQFATVGALHVQTLMPSASACVAHGTARSRRKPRISLPALLLSDSAHAHHRQCAPCRPKRPKAPRARACDVK